MRPSFGVVVLTQGSRPVDLHRAVESVLRQRDVDLDVVVVGNGWQPVGIPAGARTLGLPENLGIPAGRNAGVPQVAGTLLFFLDDDAWLPAADVLSRVAGRFAADPRIGMLQPRVVDPRGGPAPRRWTPRLRVGDPARSSDVTAVWEGGVALRREAFTCSGGWPEEFFYAHEGIELAWRVWGCGYRVRYDGGIEVHHPVIDPRRHGHVHRLSARNRVWLARRNLPVPLGVAYVATWLVLTAARTRSLAEARETLRGFVEGACGACGPRRRLSWRTAWRMTRAGRPPVI